MVYSPLHPTASEHRCMTSDSPAPPNSDEQVGFYNDLWLRQWRDMITYNPTTRQLERQIHHALLDSGGFQTLLDVGCGNGMNIAAVRRDFPDATLVGADLSPEILALARQNVGPDPGIEFEVWTLPEILCPVPSMSSCATRSLNTSRMTALPCKTLQRCARAR